MRSLRWLLPMLVIVLGPPAAAPAAAHAILVESTPAVDSTVAGPSVAFSLRYNSRIDKARSRLTLTAPDKSETVLTISPDGPEDILASEAELTPGAYRLRWQVLAIDGHITRGDVRFTVTASAQ
ncbi:MAG TPA: copper resistance CopC family protein [Stellaceae bacterium]|nr:copper resistance CopC family protein [Stellaceae bacterium]